MNWKFVDKLRGIQANEEKFLTLKKGKFWIFDGP